MRVYHSERQKKEKKRSQEEGLRKESGEGKTMKLTMCEENGQISHQINHRTLYIQRLIILLKGGGEDDCIGKDPARQKGAKGNFENEVP